MRRSISAAATMASPRISPHASKPVAGDDDRAAFIAAGDQREEQVGGLAFQGQVADLVDDDQGVALDAAHFVVQRVAVLASSPRPRP
jgi:hypothetical protein